MTKTIRQTYAPIDITGPGGIWPEALPTPTADDARNAARRLWRWATGSRFEGRIQVTTGNRRSYARFPSDSNRLAIFVNPERGWREMIHELSHSFYVYAGGVGKPHSKDHARFEIRMVKEVLKRGWLEPKPAAVEVVVDTLKLKREAKLASIDAAIKRWQSKLARAERALKKYEKQRRYYARALGLE